MAKNQVRNKNPRRVRETLLLGIFWRLLIIETVLLVLSVAYRGMFEGAGPEALFWYGVRIVFLVAVILVFMMLTLRAFLNKKIIFPLESIAAANTRFAESDPQAVQQDLPEDTPGEIQDIVSTRAAMLKTILEISENRLRLVGFIRETFGKYLSEKVVNEILESPEGAEIGGRRENVTILMSDLRGFTSLSEDRDPEEIMGLLNRYIGRMSEIIVSYDGIIDEILGDALLVVFGISEKTKDHPQRAIACAIAMQNGLRRLNGENAVQGFPELEMGIGINTGTVIAGNIGSDIRIKYGVVGVPVNTAARIESNTLGGQVLIGEPTYLAAKEHVHVKPPRTAMMKGMKAPLVFYPVTKIDPPWDVSLDAVYEEHENGSAIRLPFHYWTVSGKNVISGAMYGETVRINENWIEASIDTGVAPFENIKLRFEFCVDAHCFGDIYAKAVSDGSDPNGVYRFGITSIAPEDRKILKKWMEEVSN
ncbi:MAG: adenylate/guanylate cyclase domain-containing protein [Desulfosalsimonadaceae bacterium]